MFLTAILRTGTKNDYLFHFLVPRGNHCVAITPQLVEIAELKHFFEHFTFGKTAWSDRGKWVENTLQW